MIRRIENIDGEDQREASPDATPNEGYFPQEEALGFSSLPARYEHKSLPCLPEPGRRLRDRTSVFKRVCRGERPCFPAYHTASAAPRLVLASPRTCEAWRQA